MNKVDLLIKNGKVYTEAGFQDLDVAVSGEKIAFLAIPGAIQDAGKTIDATGKHVLPGMIDVHTHVRDPGLTHKEDYESCSRCAAASGFTVICGQANVNPVPNTVEKYRMQIDIAKKKSIVDFNPPASPLLYEEGWIPKLVKEGTAWFKIFERVAAYPYDTAAGTADTHRLFETFKEIAKTGLYCAIHPCDVNFVKAAEAIYKREGTAGLDSRGISLYGAGEQFTSGAYQLYFLAKRAGMKWYALHCNNADYIELVRGIKARGEWDVIASADCIWMGLPSIGPVKKVFDAKRNEWFEPWFMTHPIYYGLLHEGKYWDAFKDGTVDAIGTDHAPHLREEMENPDLLKAHGGLPALEWTGHLLLNEVNHGTISLETLIKVISENPAKKFLRCYPQKGVILPGSDADLTICDLGREWTITSDKVYTKTQLNPFHGKKIKGKVTHTILRGTVIMEEGEVIGKPGYGKFITPVK